MELNGIPLNISPLALPSDLPGTFPLDSPIAEVTRRVDSSTPFQREAPSNLEGSISKSLLGSSDNDTQPSEESLNQMINKANSSKPSNILMKTGMAISKFDEHTATGDAAYGVSGRGVGLITENSLGVLSGGLGAVGTLVAFCKRCQAAKEIKKLKASINEIESKLSEIKTTPPSQEQKNNIDKLTNDKQKIEQQIKEAKGVLGGGRVAAFLQFAGNICYTTSSIMTLVLKSFMLKGIGFVVGASLGFVAYGTLYTAGKLMDFGKECKHCYNLVKDRNNYEKEIQSLTNENPESIAKKEALLIKVKEINNTIKKEMSINMIKLVFDIAVGAASIALGAILLSNPFTAGPAALALGIICFSSFGFKLNVVLTSEGSKIIKKIQSKISPNNVRVKEKTQATLAQTAAELQFNQTNLRTSSPRPKNNSILLNSPLLKKYEELIESSS
jgi:hypothetical protein